MKKYYWLIAMAALLVLAAFGLRSGVKELSPAEFKTYIEKPSVVVLDVRSPGEFKEGHLPRAILINLFDEDFRAQLEKLDKNKPYAVYCFSGGRSGEAAGIMEGMGFKNVTGLRGGTSAWLKAGYKLVKE